MNGNAQQKALVIRQDMTFDALGFLPGIKAYRIDARPPFAEDLAL